MKKTKKTKHSVAMNRKRQAKARDVESTPEPVLRRQKRAAQQGRIKKNLRGGRKKKRYYEKVMEAQR